MAGEIQALFNKYQKWYPYYSRDAIVDLMLKNGVITSDIAKKIKSGASLFLLDNSAIEVNDDYLVNMDSFVSEKKNKQQEYTKLYHPKFDLLEIDNNGKVNMEQFSPDTIKKKYSDKKYRITINKNDIVVKNTQTKKVVFECFNFDTETKRYVININDDNGISITAGTIENNRIVYWHKYNKKEETIYGEYYRNPEQSSYNVYEKTIITTDAFGTRTMTTYDRKTNQIVVREVSYKDGTSKFVRYQNGKISKEWYYDKNSKETKSVAYTGGKPYVEMDSDYISTRYFLVEDLSSKIHSAKTPKSLIEDIKTRIDTENAFCLWSDYFEQTGNDLFDDIDKASLTDKEKTNLKQYLAKCLANAKQIPFGDCIAKVLHNDIKGAGSGNLKYHIEAFFNTKNDNHANHVAEYLGQYKDLTGKDLSEDIMSEYGLGEERKKLALKVDKMFCAKTNWSRSFDSVSKYLADKIYNDISGPGSGNLKEHIMMLNPDNVIGVLKYYTRPQILGVDVTKVLEFFKVRSDDYEDWAEMEPLICAIYDEWGLDDETKEKLINHVINCVDKCHKTKYIDSSVKAQYSDVAHDLTANKNDSNKVKIDAKRLDNRIESSYDNIMEPAIPSYPNGRIDEEFNQNTTGDCWLLAGLISSIRKPMGKKMLEDLLTVDNEKRQVTVNLKGVNQKYVISFDEIAASNHLVVGDGDIRAIEIAVDRFLKAQAYSGNARHVDINGNSCKTVFHVLFGNGCEKDLDNVTKEDINSPNCAYTISFDRTKIDSHTYPNAAYDEKGKPMDIIREHSYGVIKADDKFVWLLNPWNPSPDKPIRITWAKLHELDVTVEYAEFA